MAAAKQFATFIESTRNLIVPSTVRSFIPINPYFPNVRVLTIVDWSEKEIQMKLDIRYFPNVEIINYVSTIPLSLNTYLRFAINPRLHWKLYKNNSLFVAKNMSMLDYFEAKYYMNEGTSEEYKKKWNEYLDNLYKSRQLEEH
jgi:hypothetical protein